MTVFQSIINSVTELAQTMGDALQLRGMKAGGTTGQVLKKTGDGDFEITWANDTAGADVTLETVQAAIATAPDQSDIADIDELIILVPAPDEFSVATLIRWSWTNIVAKLRGLFVHLNGGQTINAQGANPALTLHASSESGGVALLIKDVNDLGRVFFVGSDLYSNMTMQAAPGQVVPVISLLNSVGSSFFSITPNGNLNVSGLGTFAGLQINGNSVLTGTFSVGGQTQLSGSQTAVDGNSAISRSLLDADFLDFNKIALRDEFIGNVDADTIIGELNWVRANFNGSGSFRPLQISPGFGTPAIHNSAAFRGGSELGFDTSNLIGGGGFALESLQNSSTLLKFRFRLSSLNVRSDIGFWNKPPTAGDLSSRSFSVNYTKAAATWTASQLVALNEFRAPTISNGRRYFASVGGTTSGSEPIWPTTAGGTVTDGTVTWKEAGRQGSNNLILMHHISAGDSAGVLVDTTVPAAINTWYDVSIRWISGFLWEVKINGTTTNITLQNPVSSPYLPFFRIENTDNVANWMAIDYWGLFSRITRP